MEQKIARVAREKDEIKPILILLEAQREAADARVHILVYDDSQAFIHHPGENEDPLQYM